MKVVQAVSVKLGLRAWGGLEPPLWPNLPCCPWMGRRFSVHATREVM